MADEVAEKKRSKRVHAIYDRIFKRLMSLSEKVVIAFINGLYGTDYSLDSIVTYVSTEGVKDDLSDTMSDVMVTIDGEHTYHMEAQMSMDETMVFRVFEYGYMRADKSKGNNVLSFPEPKIIYLYSPEEIPDEYILLLNFQGQGTFEYKVKTFNFIRTSLEELNQKRMILLIPFELLRMRKILEKDRCHENLEVLKKLLMNDIIGTIDDNLKAGNIEMSDANQLKDLTVKLYRHLYANYEEMEVDGVNELLEGALETDFDILIKEYEQKIKDCEKQVTEQVTQQMTEKMQCQMEESIARMLRQGVSHENIQEWLMVNEDQIVECEKKL
ncbi:MAG: hypothetical protein PHW47_05950 [Lachnospira sp.]|nr:hypothetical protein [Lachnospira sp.]